MSMTLKEFAEQLDGMDYDETQISSNYHRLMDIAKDNGFVVAYGASDDLLEFDGAYRDEAGGVFDGGIVTFDDDGTSDDGKEHRNKIKAFWRKVRDYEATWEYETDIPHETFKIYEEGELYCIGIVFDMRDMK